MTKKTMFQYDKKKSYYDKVCRYNKKKALYKKSFWILRCAQYDNKEVSMTIL